MRGLSSAAWRCRRPGRGRRRSGSTGPRWRGTEMTRRAWCLVGLGILLAIAVACWPTEPAIGFAAPPAWRTLFGEVEGCSGLHRDYDAIEWSVHEQPTELP